MSGTVHCLSFPWPPSVNDYWGRRHGGKLYVKRRGILFRNDVAVEVLQRGVRLGASPIYLEISAHPPKDHRKHDADNILKATFDAMQRAGAFDDDSQIRRLVLEMKEADALGRMVVLISDEPMCLEP